MEVGKFLDLCDRTWRCG
jgi:DNA repair exonuclease SbcCD ATPase subunit